MIFARKINKFPIFYSTFAQTFNSSGIQMCRNFTSRLLKNSFPAGIFFGWDGVEGNPLPETGPQAPHQLNQALNCSEITTSIVRVSAAPSNTNLVQGEHPQVSGGIRVGCRKIGCSVMSTNVVTSLQTRDSERY